MLMGLQFFMYVFALEYGDGSESCVLSSGTEHNSRLNTHYLRPPFQNQGPNALSNMCSDLRKPLKKISKTFRLQNPHFHQYLYNFRQRLPTQIHIPITVNLAKERIHQAVDEVNGFTCRFHLRSQLLVHVWEFLVRKHRNLDGIA